jgi:SPP1 family predicted phage head-tail adaptor
MNAGSLREYLSLQRSVRAVDAYGQSIQTWATFAFVWGKVEPLLGSGRLADQIIQTQATHRVRIRYRQDLRITDRLSWGDTPRILEIVQITDPDGRNAEHVLLCKERTA